MRVLVVDDSAFMRRSISRMIASDAELTVVDTACDGIDAIEKAKRLHPDVITLDIEMPRLNGLDALRRIMVKCPTAVIMVSSLTSEGSQAALKALRLGASDFILKDAGYVSLNMDSIRESLISKIKAIGSCRVRRLAPTSSPRSEKVPAEIPVLCPSNFDLLVIGSSTGGPPVVETIAMALTPGMAVPVVVAQHMPGLFTKSLAEQLNARCAIRVCEAEDGMTITPGALYLAPGGMQTRIRRQAGYGWSLRVNSEPADELYKPSVNILFASAAEGAPGRTLGVMLTGMGDDGVRGARSIKANGGTLLTQSAETCVVYGMPKAVDEAGLSSASLTPEQLCEAIQALSRDRRSAASDLPAHRAG